MLEKIKWFVQDHAAGLVLSTVLGVFSLGLYLVLTGNPTMDAFIAEAGKGKRK